MAARSTVKPNTTTISLLPEPLLGLVCEHEEVQGKNAKRMSEMSTALAEFVESRADALEEYAGYMRATARHAKTMYDWREFIVNSASLSVSDPDAINSEIINSCKKEITKHTEFYIGLIKYKGEHDFICHEAKDTLDALNLSDVYTNAIEDATYEDFIKAHDKLALEKKELVAVSDKIIHEWDLKHKIPDSTIAVKKIIESLNIAKDNIEAMQDPKIKKLQSMCDGFIEKLDRLNAKWVS